MTNELSVEEAIKVIDDIKRNTDMFDDLYLALNMAIKALEKNIQPETCPITNGVCGYPIEDCCNCPNIQAVVEQQRWIPVSERMPKDFEDVLIWYEYFRYGDYNRMFETYGIGCYISSTGTWSGDAGIGSRVKVFAWMPLPTPYKAESEA